MVNDKINPMEKRLNIFFPPYVAIIIVCLLTFFAMMPLFHAGFFPIHDDEQVGRLYELDNAVNNGHIPPRIATNLGFGYGYPLFNFYPSFVYYVAEVFVMVGFSYITSVKLMIALGFISAAVFMYLFAKEYLGVLGGIVASVAYTYAPYHAVDVYVRGALPEFWSFTFIPALFWSFKKLQETGRTQYMVYVSVLTAFLILTHNLVALMSGLFLGIYLVYLFLTTKEKKRLFKQTLFSGITGLLLSAYFWIPSYFEKNYTMIELLTTELADYRQHFVYLRQLWNSPWGYGGSLFGLEDGLSFQIGKAHLIIAGVASIAILYQIVQKTKTAAVLILFLVLFLISIFLMTSYSQFIWSTIQQFSYIQFPWRFLLFTAFTASFLVGSIFLLPIPKKLSGVIGVLIVCILILTNLNYFQPAKYLTAVTDEDYTSPEVIRWRTSIMAFEYVPKGIATKTSPLGTTVIDITKDQIARGTHQVIKGNMSVVTKVDKPQEKILTVTATESGVLRLNTFAFPGWKVFLDGKEVAYTDTNKLKLITISIPAGEHTVRALFTDTQYRIIGNTLSIVGLCLLFGYTIFDLRKKRIQP